MTLKYRNADRYLVAKREITGTHVEAETKFEEDIGEVVVKIVEEHGKFQRHTDIYPSFKSIYSHSTSQPLATNRLLNSLKDIVILCPTLHAGLKDKGEEVDKDETIALVSNLEVQEKVYNGQSWIWEVWMPNFL